MSTSPSGLFVTGTDTDVGKTVLSAALLAAIGASGKPVHAHKPVVTGIDAPADRSVPAWPADDVLLASLCGLAPEEVAPRRYGPAASPHLAARLAGTPLEAGTVLAAARLAVERAAERRATLVVEGVGGLLVPLTDDLSVRDLAAALRLPLLIAARPRLGTINHTLLTIAAARAAALDLRAVVLTPWPQQPSRLERSNRETIARIGEVEVAVLPQIAAPPQTALRSSPELDAPSRLRLATAGQTLPWRGWLKSAQRDADVSRRQ